MPHFSGGPDPEEPPDSPAQGARGRWVDFKGEKRSNDTHESKTDPAAKLMRKGRGKEAKLSFAANALMENRNGLLVDILVGEANGHAEIDAGLEMLAYALSAATVVRFVPGSDDTKYFVAECSELRVTPHVAMNDSGHRSSAIDGRTSTTPGYTISQRIRKRIEEIFGWMKTTGNMRRTRFKGVARTQLAAHMTGAAYNLLRIAKMTASPM